tara:strand:+ start:140 stop:442 length:303 start_codon:yes stop_codon:yes gene_type:complete
VDDINKYETAPLIELEDFKCPEGAKSFFIRGFDNKKLRVALWNINSDKGTIILQSGRTEFIEKYYEVIEDLFQEVIALPRWIGEVKAFRKEPLRTLGWAI